MVRSLATLLCALIPGFLLLVTAADQIPTTTAAPSLVTIQSGDLPIIISAPHGGKNTVPGVTPRKGENIALFNSKSDSWTDQLTENLADEIEKKTGKRPYVVIANFHRKFIDANRPPGLAYESKAAKSTYDAYHQGLAESRRDVIARWGCGIILDIHGQAFDADAILRGTKNGKTTTHLIGKFDQKSLVGKSSLFGQLAAQGFQVSPPVNSTNKENPKYDGGHIVRKYGSMSGGTIDAIQLELGRDLRRPEGRAETARKMASAIHEFSKQYLPKHPTRTDSIKVGVYLDKGAGRSKNDLLRTLETFHDVSIHKLTAKDIRTGKLTSLDVLIHPGGSGGTQGRHLAEEGREKIREFVKTGGGYIGICAGAYLASADYSWSLNILDAKVLDRKHWARGNGTVKLTLSDRGKELLANEANELSIHYAQGPLLAPADNPDIPDYTPVALFKTEIAKNGAPKGVMKGSTAIAQGTFGQGRVICFSPHPEMTKGLEHFVQLAIQNVRKIDTK